MNAIIKVGNHQQDQYILSTNSTRESRGIEVSLQTNQLIVST